MLPNIEDSFIPQLVNKLMGNQVNTEDILISLEFICNTFHLDQGLVYEMDFSNQFSLMEYFSSQQPQQECLHSISAEYLCMQDQTYLAQKGGYIIYRNSENTPMETQLLDLHHAQFIALSTVADSHWHVYGFIVLLHYMPIDSFTSENENLILSALSLLNHYISSRVYQKRIKQSQVTLESILDNTGIDIYVNDFNNHDVLYVNKSMAAPYGGMRAFTNRKCWQVLFPGQTGPCQFCPQQNLLDSNGEPTKVYTWDYQRPFDGSWFRVFSAAFYWVDGRVAHVVSSADITDNKRNEAIIENLANYDQLTQLPNRRMLLKECESRIDHSHSKDPCYLLFFDIDGFKSVNDTYGHDSGDEFLINLGKFFTSIPLLEEAIYRNGGDEFVALIGGEGITKDNIRNLASFIHRRFQQPWILRKGNIYCNTSIGVACYPEDGQTAEALLQSADMAMYQVKKAGGGNVCFGYELHTNQEIAIE